MLNSVIIAPTEFGPREAAVVKSLNVHAVHSGRTELQPGEGHLKFHATTTPPLCTSSERKGKEKLKINLISAHTRSVIDTLLSKV